jgi:hypothetical protein
MPVRVHAPLTPALLLPPTADVSSVLVYVAPALAHPGARDMELLLPALRRRRRVVLLLSRAAQLKEVASAGEEARGKWLKAVQGAAAEEGVEVGGVSVVLAELSEKVPHGAAVQSSVQVRDAVLKACHEHRRASG